MTEIDKQEAHGARPYVWQGEVREMPFSYTVKGFLEGSWLAKGTPLDVDVANRTATICKAATVLDDPEVDTLTLPVGNPFLVGDRVTADGATWAVITAIANTSPDVETVTLDGPCGAAKSGTLRTEDTPNAVLAADTLFFAEPGGEERPDGEERPPRCHVQAADNARLMASDTGWQCPDEWLTGNAFKRNANITVF